MSTLNPIWEEDAAFDIHSDQDLLKLEVWDKDFGGDKDDFLGKCYIDI